MKKNSFLVKFIALAMVMGFFSPSIEFQPSQVDHTQTYASLSGVSVSLLHEAKARPVRRATRRTARRTTRRTVTRTTYHHRRYPGGFYRGGGYYRRGVYHPVAAFTVVTLSALAIGSIISSSSMSSSCTSASVNGIKYKVCDGTWFKPFYEGDSLQYKAVSKPQ